MVINKRLVAIGTSAVLGVCLICAGVGYGIITYTEKEVAAALAAQEAEYETILFENPPADEVLPSSYWTEDGYEDFVSWWTALKELRDSAEGMTDAAMEDYDYLTEEHQAQLLEIENQMIFAMSVKEWTELKAEFDNVIKDAEPAPEPAKTVSQSGSTKAPVNYSGNYDGSYYDFMRDGIVYDSGKKYTYYSERVLPGGGLNIPGRHTSGGFVRDENGYIVLANGDHYGEIVETPWGTGKVYDSGTYGDHYDVYVE